MYVRLQGQVYYGLVLMSRKKSCMITRMSDQLIEYLSEQLQKRRWSQRTLAMYAGISPNTVSYAMQGKTIPDPETIEKLARALGVDEYHMLRLAGHVEGPRQSNALKIRPKKRNIEGLQLADLLAHTAH